MAPHGGGIEPGTIDIADALAGSDYSFYGFKGLKKAGNAILHINSNNFDEPIGVAAAQAADVVVSIHGAKDTVEVVYVGGRNETLKSLATQSLAAAGFNAADSRPGLQGRKPDNICNRCRSKKGLQIELSRGLRETLFENLAHRSLRKKTAAFYAFVSALRRSLELFAERHDLASRSG